MLAKLLALTTIDLLYDGAESAYRLISAYQPEMSRSEYIDYQSKLFRSELFNGSLM